MKPTRAWPIAVILAAAWMARATPATAQGGVSVQTGVGSGQGPIIVNGQQQTIPMLAPGSGSISGLVSDAETGAPLPNVLVRLNVSNGNIAGRVTREVTDGKGRFVFSNLPARDDYQVVASLPGYFDAAYGQTSLRPGTTSIALESGQWFGNANITLSKGGSVSGTVFDEHGEPVVGVFVRVIAQVFVGGVKQFASGPATSTDDRGAYRIANLGPGDYLVSVPSLSATVPATAAISAATVPYAVFDPDAGAKLALGRYPVPPPPQSGRRFAYPAVYAPDATVISRATAVTLGLGDSRTNVDLHLIVVPAATIKGTVDSPMTPVPPLTLRLLPSGAEALGNGSEAGTAMLAPDGTFTFLNVPAGTYTIEVRRAAMELVYNAAPGPLARLPLPPGSNSYSINSSSVDSGGFGVSAATTEIGDGVTRGDLWGRATVMTSGSDLSGVVVPLHHGSRIAGRVATDMKDPSVNNKARPIFVRADPADGSPSSGQGRSFSGANDDPLAFDMPALTPGRYVLWFGGGLSNLVLESITIDGEDFTRRPIDVSDGHDVTNVRAVLTNRTPTLSGVARGSDTPAKSLSVIVFPVEPDEWANYGFSPIRIKTTSVNAQGGYHLSSLPEGDYFVVCVPTGDVDAWQSPAFLKRAATVASRVSLKWGQSATADAPLVRVR